MARGYGRRDYYLRRLLLVADVACLAMALARGARGHSWREYLLYGSVTLPAWVVLSKMYGLYERDAKRLSHSTLDDLPPLFHALLLGCLLMWCWFTVAAPFKLVFATVLLFGACVSAGAHRPRRDARGLSAADLARAGAVDWHGPDERSIDREDAR